MKWGILVSAILLTIIVIVAIVSERGFSDNPTNLSKPENLKLVDLSGLPTVSSTAGNGDGTPWFDEMVELYKTKGTDLELQADRNNKLVDGQRLADMFIRLCDQGPPSNSRLDGLAPIKPRASCAAAFEILAAIAMRQADESVEKDHAKARKIATSVFTVGKWMFERTKRIPVKDMGYSIMEQGLRRLRRWADKDKDMADKAEAWNKALDSYREGKFMPKYALMSAVETKDGGKTKNYGDLIRICYEDKDVAWRVEATLTLGLVKFAPNRGRGNDRAIREAIEKLKSDKEPLVAEAAKHAEKMTKEDVRAN